MNTRNQGSSGAMLEAAYHTLLHFKWYYPPKQTEQSTSKEETINLDCFNQNFFGDFLIFKITYVIWRTSHLFLIYKWVQDLPWRKAGPRADLKGYFWFSDLWFYIIIQK